MPCHNANTSTRLLKQLVNLIQMQLFYVKSKNAFAANRTKYYTHSS